jgi:hypothetical protein
MNTDLMTKLQTLIYSNQDKLEQLVGALENVCNESSTVMTPKYTWAPKNPYDDYVVSEKDVGSIVKLWNNGSTPRHRILARLDTNFEVRNYSDGGVWWDNAAPCTDPVKLNFKPFYATADSEMPSELHSGMWIALLFNEGAIDITDCPDNYGWSYHEGFQYIVGYQVLQFVNPVLDK